MYSAGLRAHGLTPGVLRLILILILKIAYRGGTPPFRYPRPPRTNPTPLKSWVPEVAHPKVAFWMRDSGELCHLDVLEVTGR